MSNLIFKQDGARKNPKTLPFDAFVQNNFEEEIGEEPPIKTAPILGDLRTEKWELAFDLEMEHKQAQEVMAKTDRQKKEEIRRAKMQPFLAEAKIEADNILAEANHRAGQILDAAKKRSEEIEATAYQAGFEQGEAAGKQLGEQKIEPVVRNLRTVIEALGKERDALMQAAEEDLAKTAILIGLQLVHREISQNPSVVLDMVRAALSKVQRATKLAIYTSPIDFKYLEDHKDFLQAMLEPGVSIDIESDASIQRGGCKIISDTGEVDATIHCMMEKLKDRLLEEGNQDLTPC